MEAFSTIGIIHLDSLGTLQVLFPFLKGAKYFEFQESGGVKGRLDYPSLHARFYRDYGGFPDGSVVKNLPATVGDKRDLGSISGSGRSPGGVPGSPLLPGESQGQRSLADYSP